MLTVYILRYLECPVFSHISKRAKALLLRCFRQTWDRVLKNPTVVFVNGDLFPRFVRRLKVLAYTSCTVWVKLPRQFDPTLVSIPDRAGGCSKGGLSFLSSPFLRDSNCWLPESNPLSCVSFVTMKIMPLWAKSSR